MLITDYTTYDDVRAVLGVSTDELEDTTLALETYASALLLDLEDVDVALPATYSALPGTGRTAAQERFFVTVRLFATYAVARQLTSSLPMFGPKDITDGKAGVTRFADSPYKETIKRLQAEYDRYRTRLEKAYAGLTAGAYTLTVPTFLSVASPTSDPVTGT